MRNLPVNLSLFSPGRRARPLALALLAIWTGVAIGQDTPRWRYSWANDEFLGSDNQFTNGISLQKHSILADPLAVTSGTPAFGKRLASWVLPDRDDLFYRETWTIGQNMQTPNNINTRELILTDVPYVGMLGWANSFIAFNDRELTGFQTLLGWVGDLTLAVQAQSTAHRITGASDPNGWRNQLDNEPLLNVYVMRKHRLDGCRLEPGRGSGKLLFTRPGRA